jgi:hypothetical protein
MLKGVKLSHEPSMTDSTAAGGDDARCRHTVTGAGQDNGLTSVQAGHSSGDVSLPLEVVGEGSVEVCHHYLHCCKTYTE